MKRQPQLKSLVLISVLFTLLSCSKSASSTSTLAGNWHKMLGSVTVYLNLKTDGTYAVGYDAGGGYTQTVTGTYSSTASQFTILTASGTNTCPTTQGTYTWAVNGNTLTTTVVNDSCVSNGQARSDYAAGVYTK